MSLAADPTAKTFALGAAMRSLAQHVHLTRPVLPSVELIIGFRNSTRNPFPNWGSH
jgi:hypothetical protein